MYFCDAKSPDRPVAGLQKVRVAVLAFGVPLLAYLFRIHDAGRRKIRRSARCLDGYEATGALSSFSRGRLRPGHLIGGPQKSMSVNHA